MKAFASAGFIVGVCFAANLAVAGDVMLKSAVPSKVSALCQSCHGPGGNSTSTTTPRLNAQNADYIAARFRSFLDPGRQDAHATAAMWGVARQVDDQAIAAIARYYASQTPTRPGGAGPLAAAGRRLYERGDAAENIPSCRSCHGPRAEGNAATPRLAGQHADYLKAQLERLRLGLRASDTMHPKTNGMTDQQIAALVAHLAND